MHFLHAILVNVEEYLGYIPQPEEYESVKEQARNTAMMETEEYYGSVFDWRTEDNAGRWSDLYPGTGVVLGAEDRERFLQEFLRWKDMPLKKALECYAWSSLEQVGWRTQEEIDTYNSQARQEGYPELIVAKEVSPLFVEDGETEKFFSGLPKSMDISKDVLLQIWESDSSFCLYNLKLALELVYGDYKFNSQFYSLPDYSSRVSKHTLEDVLAHPEKYALVFSDYHN